MLFSNARSDLSAMHDRYAGGRTDGRQLAAFTLIELLVVIAVVASLAAMLLPASSKGKARALSVSCMNNLRQLQVCWHVYAVDHNDLLPPNNSVADINTGNALASAASWCTNTAPYDTDPQGIQNGLLFPYNSSLGIYHCPADRSTVETRDGNKRSDIR